MHAERCPDAFAWKIVYHADPYTKFSMQAPDLNFVSPPRPSRPEPQALGNAANLCHSLMIEHLNNFSSEAGAIFCMEFDSSAL